MSNFQIRRTSVIALAVIIIAVIGFKFLSGLKKGPQKDTGKAKIIKVDIIDLVNQDITANISINGRLKSKNRIDVFSEVTGKLLKTNKAFKEGVKFKKGETLLKLDDSNYRMNLNASRSSFHSLLTQLLAEIMIEYPDNFSNWETYINAFNPEAPIAVLPEMSNTKEKNYWVSKNVMTQYYNIKSQEAQLDKYRMVAPFDGVVNMASINPNSVVRAGQKLAEFINPDLFEVEVGISLVEISKISVGDEVKLFSSDIEGAWNGKISRISESIDEKTMTFKIYVEVRSDQLYEGMYLKGNINSFTLENVTKIPSHLIVRGANVYVAKDSTLHIQKVNIVHESEGFTMVKGLKDHTKIVNHSIANAYEGMKITLN